jgi:DNA-binding CsgD family transcriptional regulator
MVSAGLGRSAALAASMLALMTGAVQAFARAADPAAASLTDIRVLFKLDPRLSGPTYGGERWLSRPTFTSGVQEGTVGKVDVKVQGVDATGRVVSVVPEWTAADPEMVTVTAGENNQFRITVKRPGESKLRVASQGVSKELVVKAKSLAKAIQVEIIQEPVWEPRRAGGGADPGATVAPPSADPGRVAVAADAPVLRDEKAKNSYALGMEMGGRLKGEIRELDADLVFRGLRDAMSGDEPLLTEAELKTALAAVQSEVRAIVEAAAVKQLEFTAVLVRAIQAVAAGEIWANRHATSEALEGPTVFSDRASKIELTRREQQIADACSRGLRNKEIAARLNISTKTVKSHLNNIFRKLQLDNRVALALQFQPKVLGLPL